MLDPLYSGYGCLFINIEKWPVEQTSSGLDKVTCSIVLIKNSDQQCILRYLQRINFFMLTYLLLHISSKLINKCLLKIGR